MPFFRSCAAWARAFTIVSTAVGCSVITSLDGLTGGAPGSIPIEDAWTDGGLAGTEAEAGGDSSAPDGAPLDGGEDTTSDATIDAGIVQEAAADAGGPPPVDAGPKDACAPTPLACDGKAHACDGIVDEGCPSAVPVGAAGAPRVLGGDTTTGSPFSDPCPGGQVLIGMGGATGAWIDAVYAICGVVALKVSTSSTPYTYGVTTLAGTTLPTRGTVGTSDAHWQATCGPNQAVIGVAGNSGGAMDHVVLLCAPLTISGSPGSFALGRGIVTSLPPQGDSSGGSPFPPVVCPAPQVVALIAGTAAQWVNSLEIGCSAPSLSLVH